MIRRRVLTEYGPRPTTANNTVAAPEAGVAHERSMWRDLLLGLAMVAIPVALICCIHFCFLCQLKMRKQRKMKKTRRSDLPTPVVEPLAALHSALAPTANMESSAADPLSKTPPRRPKSKSVTWQSPFETHGRRSRPSVKARMEMAASELHFVMVATPDKYKTPPRHPHPQQTTPAKLRPSNDPLPQHRLDFLDSPVESEIAISSCNSSISDRLSFMPMLERGSTDVDDDEVQADESVRVSVSSLVSDDPETTARLDEAMRWTQQDMMQALAPSQNTQTQAQTRMLRASSSLNDFRYDLHHEQAADRGAEDNQEPEQITRSSEYSF